MVDPVTNAVNSCDNWYSCEANLIQNSYMLKLSIYKDRNNDSINYFSISQNNITFAFIPLNNNVEAKFNFQHLHMTFKEFGDIKVVFNFTNLQQLEQMVSYLSDFIQNGKVTSDQLYSINSAYLYSISCPNHLIESISRENFMAATPGRAFATPILTSKTHYDLWEKQVLLNNASYVTKPRILRVAFLTWNVASVKPHPIVIEEISHAFQIGDSPTDIIFIALEEIDMGVVSVVKGSSKVKDLWSKIISITLSKTGGYHLKSELSLGGVYTALIMRNGLSPEPVCGDVKTIRLGAHGLAANKGAIMYPFTIGGTRFTFMGCHLSPHQENWQSRDQQLRNLLKLADKNFDFLAIIGDLNYRIEMTYEECISFISQKDADTLYLRDQLQISRNNDPILRRFKEPKITFFPTFKFDKESDVYDTSPKHRVPSYTDRVLLVRGRKRLSIGTSASPILDQKPDIQLNFPSMPKCVTYKSGVCKFSDHRSVLCGYKFIIPDIDVQKLMDLKEAIKNRISELQKQLIPTCTVSNQNIILDSNPKSFKLINTSKAWAQWQINYDKETVKVLPDNGVLLPNMEIEINVAMINVDQGKLEIEIARGNKIEIKLARGGILIGTSGSNVMNQNKNLEQWMFG